MRGSLLAALTLCCLLAGGCGFETMEHMTVDELESQLSAELSPGDPLPEVLSVITWTGLKSEREPTTGCVGFIGWEECGRILPAYFLYASTGLPCNTDIVVVFRFDELNYLESFVLRERWFCL